MFNTPYKSESVFQAPLQEFSLGSKKNCFLLLEMLMRQFNESEHRSVLTGRV